MKIVFIIVLICVDLTTSLYITPMTNKEVCVQLIKKKISCIFNDNEFHVHLSPNVQIIKNSKNLLKISCFQTHELNFEKVPPLKLSDVSSLEIHKCSIKKNLIKILSTIQNILKLENVRKLLLIIDTEQGKDITSQVFEKFTKLEKLTIFTARNDKFYSNTFEPLEKLKFLELNIYDITSVPKTLFVSLSNLKTLNVTSTASRKSDTEKQLTFSLKNCTKLEKITIKGIRRSIDMKLELGSLVDYVSVTENINISSLQLDTHKYAKNLEHIDLSNNLMNIFDSKIIRQQTGLRIIDLSRNKIERITESMFADNDALEEIDLSHNKIVSIDRKAFLNQRYLQKLFLNNNELRIIHLNIFETTSKSMTLLSLKNNNLTMLNGEIAMENRLKTIDLSYNNLSWFFVMQFWPKSIKNLTVILSNNLLQNIDFREIPLTQNKTLTNFLTIKLEDTRIDCNCHTKSLYEFLTKKLETPNADLIYNNVKISPQNPKCQESSVSSVKYVESLTPLNAVCPLDFNGHTRLCNPNCACSRSLDNILTISCANITAVPPLPKYETLNDIVVKKIILYISSNGVRKLPTGHAQPHFDEITEIHASYNVIENISNSNLPKNLEFLDLKNNLLKHINPNTLKRLAALKSIYLSQNPWNCSSIHAKDLISFIKTHRKLVKDFQVIKCSNGKYFLEFEDENYCNKHIVLTTIVTFASFIIIIAIALFCHKKKQVSEWIFINDKYHLVEKVFDFFKPMDICILCTKHDKVFGNYIGSKVIRKPNSLKCCLVIKTWESDQKIPEKFLQIFRKSKRIIIILTEYFSEKDWNQWSYGNLGTRIILITKGSIQSDGLVFENCCKNKKSIRFNDPLFWDKLKYSIERRNEVFFDSEEENEFETLL